MAFTYKTTKEEEAAKKKQSQDEQNLRNHQTYKPGEYQQSSGLQDMWNTITNWQTPTWDKTNNTWWNKLTDTMNAIENREKFSYDVNGDALYQQYKDQYVNLGNMAMMDTMGQAAAMTGGYGNSYAQSVGQQAYQGYMQQLADKVPELYQMALDQYNREGDEMYNKLSAYGSLYGTEYGEYRDSVTDSNNERSNLLNMYGIKSDEEYSQWYNNEQMQMTASQQEYQKLADMYGISTEQAKYLHDIAYQSQYDKYATGVAEDQWQKSYNLQAGELGLQREKFNWEKDQSNLAAENEALRNQYVVNTKEYAKAKKTIISEEAFKDKAKFGSKSVYGPKKAGALGEGYFVYDGQTYSSYKDYAKKTIGAMYEAGEINEATAKKLLEDYGI